MTFGLFNPDDLPVSDPLAEAADQILYKAEVSRREACGILFRVLYRLLDGQADDLPTSHAKLLEYCDGEIASVTTIRYALGILEKARLLSVSSKPRRPGIVVHFMKAPPKPEQMLLLDEEERPKPLGIVADNSPAPLRSAVAQRTEDATALRNGAAQRSCAETGTKLVKKSKPLKDEGVTPQGLVHAGDLARRFLERSTFSYSSSSCMEESKDVQNVLNVQDPNVEKCSDEEQEADRRAALFEVVQKTIKAIGPPKRGFGVVPFMEALLVVEGPLSQSEYWGAVESAAGTVIRERGKSPREVFGGAIKEILSSKPPELLKRYGAWHKKEHRANLQSKDYTLQRLLDYGIDWDRATDRPKPRPREPHADRPP